MQLCLYTEVPGLMYISLWIWIICFLELSVTLFINMFFSPIYHKAKKSRHSPDTVEEMNLLFPKGCDIMGIATPGIVCKCFFFFLLPLSCFIIHRHGIIPKKNRRNNLIQLRHESVPRMRFRVLMVHLCGLMFNLQDTLEKINTNQLPWVYLRGMNPPFQQWAPQINRYCCCCCCCWAGKHRWRLAPPCLTLW